MKILFISDTHGNIDLINDAIRSTNADVCLHCGDFGFYNEASVPFFTDDELRKLIKHSALNDTIKEQRDIFNRQELEDLTLTHKLFGNFGEYQSGKNEFLAPVYTIWGNHDDLSVVASLVKNPIKNLHILTEETPLFLDNFCFLALGGNLDSSNIKNRVGQASKLHPECSVEQLSRLIDSAKSISRRYTKILLTHSTPEEEILVKLLAWCCDIKYTVSGHLHHYKVSETQSTKESELQGVIEELNLPQKEFHPQTPLSSISHVTLATAKKGYGFFDSDAMNDFSIMYTIINNKITLG